MKRTDIKDIFPDATDDQIKRLMDLNGTDIENAKSGVEDIRKQLNTANTALEQAKKEAASAISADDMKKMTDRAAELENELNGLKTANQLRDMRHNVAKEKNVPFELLTAETEDECRTQADAILTFAKSTGYPHLPDGGELGPVSVSTRDQFASWAAQQFS